MRTFRYRFYPNRAQVAAMERWFGAARWLWNRSLETRTKAWTRRRKSLTAADFSRLLARLKASPSLAWLN